MMVPRPCMHMQCMACLSLQVYEKQQVDLPALALRNIGMLYSVNLEFLRAGPTGLDHNPDK